MNQSMITRAQFSLYCDGCNTDETNHLELQTQGINEACA